MASSGLPLPCAGGLWVPSTEDDGETHGKGNPPENIVKMIAEHGQMGIVISGVISWIETERHTSAGGIWKQVAGQCWGPVEVSEARKQMMLLMTSKQVDDLKKEDNNFAKTRNATTDPTQRKMKEIEDIATILEFLWLSRKMPLILASTCQMRKSPKTLGSVGQDASMAEVMTKMQSMETCMSRFMNSSMNQMETLTEIVKEQRTAPPKFPQPTNTPGKKRKLDEEIYNTTNENVADMDVVEVDVEEHMSTNESYASRTMAGITPLKGAGQGPSQSNQMLKNVLKNLVEKKTINQNDKKKEKPKRRHIFHGKAIVSNTEDVIESNLAADVEIVAFGVSKTAEPEHRKKFLTDRGINVEDVKCLTRDELVKDGTVRSKTMKVTVKASEHEKAMKPDVWPQRVGVRYYKAPSRKPGAEEGGEEGAGGLLARGQVGGQGGWGHQGGGARPRHREKRDLSQGGEYRSQQKHLPPGSREWNQMRRNRYEEVDGWNVPRGSHHNSPITIEKIQQAIREINSSP